jgi:hypothetical protein
MTTQIRKTAMLILSAVIVPAGFVAIFVATLALTRANVARGPILPQSLQVLFWLSVIYFLLVSLALIFWTSRRRVVAVIGIYSWVIASVTAIALIVSGPALAERSLTIYLLETLASVNEPMEKSQLEVATTKGWWPAYDQTAIRINEQLALGNIVRGARLHSDESRKSFR